ncbi:MAG: S41 family peptidase, partial [Planctomycetota bacterium]
FAPEQGFQVGVTADEASDGERSLRVSAPDNAEAGAWLPVTQRVDVEKLRGKRIRYLAMVKADVASNMDGVGPGAAQLWLRVDRPMAAGFFDNMGDRPIRTNRWQRYEIVGEVAHDATDVFLGVFLRAPGALWLDDVRLEVIGEFVEGEGNVQPRALTQRELANAEAVVRLMPIIEHWHPADQAEGIGWESFTVRALDTALDAETDEALVAALVGVIRPIAPTVRIWAGDAADAPAAHEALRTETAQVAGIENIGRGPSTSIYRSTKRVAFRANDSFVFAEPGSSYRAELVPGVWCDVPLTLPYDGGTLPHGDAPPVEGWRPEGWTPNVDDLLSRLTAAGRAWMVFEHFYPHWDVVDVDWDAALRTALGEVAAAPDELQTMRALQRLVAKAEDGHGSVASRLNWQRYSLPASLVWAGDRLVVTVPSEGSGLERGDAVTAIDGRPVSELRAEAEAIISGATQGWLDDRTRRLVGGSAEPEIPVVIERGDEQLEVVVTGIGPAALFELEEARPANGDEVADGVVYVNLVGMTTDALNELMPLLAEAEGIVFDLRGYPDSGAYQLLSHLSGDTIFGPWWNIPTYKYPEQRDVEYRRDRWVLRPSEPTLTPNTVWVIDGSAISYAESVMGTIEGNGLGTIVGAPTAGTNGNINTVDLFTGDTRVIWTGMRVTKHDDTAHHGTGVLPTVTVERTVEGIRERRDELLERAVEIAAEGAVR